MSQRSISAVRLARQPRLPADSSPAAIASSTAAAHASYADRSSGPITDPQLSRPVSDGAVLEFSIASAYAAMPVSWPSP